MDGRYMDLYEPASWQSCYAQIIRSSFLVFPLPPPIKCPALCPLLFCSLLEWLFLVGVLFCLTTRKLKCFRRFSFLHKSLAAFLSNIWKVKVSWELPSELGREVENIPDAAFPSMPFQLTVNTLKRPPKVCSPLVMLFFVSSRWPSRLILKSPADVDLDYPATVPTTWQGGIPLPRMWQGCRETYPSLCHTLIGC